MLLAILLTILAAGFTNVGKALQKQGTRTLPRLVYDAKVVREYLKHPTWGLGLALDIGGGLLSIAALARAPVSVVQPIASGGLAILAVFSHFYLEERLAPREWAAVGLAAAGTVGVAASAPEPVADADVAVSLRGLVALAALLAGGEGALRWAHAHAHGVGGGGSGSGGSLLSGGGGSGRLARAGSGTALHRMGVGAARVDELAAGARAGALFSLSAASCRTGLLLSHSARLAAPAGLAAAAALTAAGVVEQTRGLKDGAAMVICTAGAVTTMLVGAAAGVLVLGEGLPVTPRGRLTWLLAWGAIAGGVAGISGAGKQSGHVKGVTPLKLGGGGGGSGAGGAPGAMTPGGAGSRLLLPLFVRPPKEPDSAL